jgi:hypothetical protein
VKRIGPELKMPKLKGSEIKVPPFLSDLYYDLRERRLLPIVALILVAIVAAPFLLGGKGSEEPEPVPVPITGSGASASASGRSLTVVQAKPGLRNYKKRLARRKPTNPFKQRFDGPVLKGAQLNPQTETSTGSTPESSIPAGEPPPGGTSPVPSPGGPTITPGTITYFAWAIDVRITKPGGSGSASSSGLESDPGAETDSSSEASSSAAAKASPETEVRHRVLPLTSLPGPKTPVVTYLAPAKAKKGNVILLVSDKVRSVFGETRCVSGFQVCQLLEVEPKFPVTFSFGANDVRYTFEVLNMERVVTGHG